MFYYEYKAGITSGVAGEATFCPRPTGIMKVFQQIINKDISMTNFLPDGVLCKLEKKNSTAGIGGNSSCQPILKIRTKVLYLAIFHHIFPKNDGIYVKEVQKN